MKKALITATVQSHIAHFHKPLINMLRENGFEVHAAAKNDLVENKGLILENADKLYNVNFSRSPYSKDNIAAYKHIKNILSENTYDIIHCNTPMGAVVTRLAARKARKNGTKIIYTAHGFHFFKGAPLVNWLFYYPIERIMARVTDVLITINKEDYNRAKKFKAGRVEYVPGVGLNVEKFANHSGDKEVIRKAIGIPSGATVLLSVGELSKRKNHQIIIRALATLKDKNIYYIIVGTGKLERELKTLAASLKVEKQVHLLGFRTDVADLYKAADIFCFPSLHEGLPVAMMEAMASGLPIICSRIRGNSDLTEHEKGGLMYGSMDKRGFAEGIRKLCSDAELRENMGNRNKRDAMQYDAAGVLKQMKAVYENCLSEKLSGGEGGQAL